mmetsp:Transcript_14440/g.35010  ORF Transcript_14440/g.35010 Transcript_14440/m.35010 type:complete len:469 (+) Transcript_14440:76-1482(+)
MVALQEPLIATSALHTMTNSQGMKIAFREWALPAARPSKGVVFVAHAAAEHSGRYQKIASHLNSKGYEVFALDHQGHGESEGERAHVVSFGDYVSDLERFIKHVITTKLDARPNSANTPRFLMGHSMGALVAVQAGLKRSFGDLRIRGVILLSPGLTPPPKANANSLTRSIRSSVAPKSTLPFPNKTLSEPLTHDPASDEAYRSDPLVYLGGLRARFTSEVLAAMHATTKAAPEFSEPLLVMFGTENKLNSYADAQRWFSACGSSDKTFVPVPGAFHELHNEADPYFSLISDELSKWMNARLTTSITQRGLATATATQGEVVYASPAAGSASRDLPAADPPVQHAPHHPFIAAPAPPVPPTLPIDGMYPQLGVYPSGQQAPLQFHAESPAPPYAFDYAQFDQFVSVAPQQQQQQHQGFFVGSPPPMPMPPQHGFTASALPHMHSGGHMGFGHNFGAGEELSEVPYGMA